MNKRSFLYLLLILIAATLLRLWNLDKPEGMWNDEFVTWRIASAKFPFDFFDAIRSNCHAPLHYFYLKLWMLIFKDGDTMLRLSSVVPGVLSVVVMFFASLELKNQENGNTALTAAVFCAISSFLIYFSQEIRIYSLLFFITTLVLLYALKIFNNPSKKNFALYSLFCVLLILTHTIGFVFVFFSTAALFVFAVPKKKTKDFALFSILGVVLLALPFLPLISTILFKHGYFSQWWAPFNFSRTLFIFTDIFSPVLTDTAHIYNTFADAFYKGENVNLGYLVFAVVPALIGIICMIRALLDPKREHWYLFTVSLCTVFTVLIAAMAGKIVFVTKYMTEILPLVILLGSEGFCRFSSKGFKIALGTIFIVLNLFYLSVSNTSAVKLIREEGQRLPVVALQDMGLKKNDKILFLYYDSTWFHKYVNFENPDNEPYLKAMYFTKYNFSAMLDNVPVEKTYKQGKELLKSTLSMDVNPTLDRYINETVLNDVQKGHRLFIVDLTSVSFFPKSVVKTIVNTPQVYNSTPLLYIAMSYIKNYTLEAVNKELVYIGYKDTGAWRIYAFERV